MCDISSNLVYVVRKLYFTQHRKIVPCQCVKPSLHEARMGTKLMCRLLAGTFRKQAFYLGQPLIFRLTSFILESCIDILAMTCFIASSRLYLYATHSLFHRHSSYSVHDCTNLHVVSVFYRGTMFI